MFAMAGKTLFPFYLGGAVVTFSEALQVFDLQMALEAFRGRDLLADIMTFLAV
jgi:hypothetical protein